MSKFRRYIKPLVHRTQEDNLILRKVAVASGLPELIYEDFSVFAYYMMPKIGLDDPLDWEWFHYAICAHYNEIIFGKSHFLTMEIGPQVGKSIFTALFVAYVIGLRPNISTIYSTYNEAKVADFTQKYLIHFMGGEKYKLVFEHISLKNELDKKDQSKKAQILRKTQKFTDTEISISNGLTLESNGRFYGIAIGQGIHGKPANIFIVDDYTGKGEDTTSQLFRDKRNRWFSTDMSSRLQNLNSIVIVLCTRWYYEDIIGLFQKAYYERVKPMFEKLNFELPKFEVIKYRAEYRPDDEYKDSLDPRTTEGQLLWEEKALQYAMAKGDDEDFNALYNCDPSATDGAEKIKPEDFAYYQQGELPCSGRIYMVIDAGGTATQKSDKTAIQVWLVNGANKYLIKLYYVKMRSLELSDFVYNLLTNEWAEYDECVIEHTSGGITVCEHLIHNKKMPNIIRMSVTGRPLGDETPVEAHNKIKGANSKLERYNRILSIFRKPTKTIFLPAHQIEHQDEFLKQITKFTGDPGRKDDHADAFVYFLLRTKNNVVFMNKDSNNFVAVNDSGVQSFLRVF
jgi:hypothetical protein